MTIVVACAWGGVGAIGCDSIGVDGWQARSDHGTKLCRTGFGWIGGTGTFRMSQVIGSALAQCADVHEAPGLVGAALERAGWHRRPAEKDALPQASELAQLLLTHDARVFLLQADLSLLPCFEPAACGSGYLVALGAAHVMRAWGADPVATVKAALRASFALIGSTGGTAFVETTVVERVDRARPRWLRV